MTSPLIYFYFEAKNCGADYAVGALACPSGQPFARFALTSNAYASLTPFMRADKLVYTVDFRLEYAIFNDIERAARAQISNKPFNFTRHCHAATPRTYQGALYRQPPSRANIFSLRRCRPI